jgi:hypothetical protein
MKEDALAIVPLNIGKLEGILVDRTKKISPDDKRNLLAIIRKNVEEKRCLLQAKRQEVEEMILQAEREKAGLKKFREEMDTLDEQIQALSSRRDVIRLRCENGTGFTIDGALLYDRGRGYGKDDEATKLWATRHRPGMNKADAIREKISLATQRVERFALKFDKVEARLILSTTMGEAMDIMDAVLGNGDEILQAGPVATEAEVVR